MERLLGVKQDRKETVIEARPPLLVTLGSVVSRPVELDHPRPVTSQEGGRLFVMPSDVSDITVQILRIGP
jgi:hypothetical protein